MGTTSFPGVDSALRQGLATLSLDTEYRTGETDLVRDFYGPCLSHSISYDRAVGYFRSTVFAVAGYAVVRFAGRGGRMRMVCSPSLTHEDLEALSAGYGRRAEIIAGVLEQEVSALLAEIDVRAHAEVLATLIVLGVLDLRIAIRPPAHGIYHEKIGIFTDEHANMVSFRGSSNETWQGWHEQGNLESFEVFCSWRGGIETERVNRHKGYFERLWRNEVRDVDVMPFPEAAKRRLCSVAKSNLEELKPSDIPLPPSMTPRPHQLNALERWRSQNRRGILAHATGSGKTYTAMLAIREHTGVGGVALVLVPSQLLLDQWTAEIETHIPGIALLKAGAGHERWREQGRLESFSRPASDVGPRVILAMMQTASKEEFRKRLAAGSHVLLIADEVHQIGSPQHSRVMEIDAGARLGLSATPERFGDPVGTQQVFSYFGGVIPPPFLLKEAINAGLLVHYEYLPHAVHLTSSENDSWGAITKDIKREVAKLPRTKGQPIEFSDRVKLLLIQRARIAKKAAGKVPMAVRVLVDGFAEGQRWLVYCEDNAQLQSVLTSLGNNGIDANEYHSAMVGDRQATLDWFKRFGGVLVSIRCLDEGVDIPDVTHALILASSQNPRQFIQRRGRVLRRAPGKQLAVIHDAIVVPESVVDEPDQVALAKAELARALEFAESALNRLGAAELRDIAVHLGLDPEGLMNTGVEEEENGADERG